MGETEGVTATEALGEELGVGVGVGVAIGAWVEDGVTPGVGASAARAGPIAMARQHAEISAGIPTRNIGLD